MSLYDQLILEGEKKGIEKGIEKNILAAFDNGILIPTIKLMTGKSDDEITAILRKNNRI